MMTEHLRRGFEVAMEDSDTFMNAQRLDNYYEGNVARLLGEALALLTTVVEQQHQGFDLLFFASSETNTVVPVRVGPGIERHPGT